MINTTINRSVYIITELIINIIISNSKDTLICLIDLGKVVEDSFKIFIRRMSTDIITMNILIRLIIKNRIELRMTPIRIKGIGYLFQ
jgi:hypothetical protein